MMIVNEENVSVKISMPLIDDIELQRIDTFYNDIVSEYTKAFVKEKEQVIVQRLMMNLQQENARLKDKIDESIKYIRDCCDMDSKWVNLHYDYAQKEMSSNEVDRLLEILKEN